MQMIEVSQLKAHPKNNYFFDDMSGENWDAFLESVKTSGVIEPVIATQDMVIVSGHQRVRACKALGVKDVLTDIRTYGSDDEVLKQLIETNIRQRGVGNTNAIKLGRCIKELERIYGIKNGGDRKSELNNSTLKTESDLAAELGVSRYTLQNYKKLTELIPEVQDLVETGYVSPTIATAIARQMSEEEQAKFVEALPVAKKVTQKEIDAIRQELARAKQDAFEAKTEKSRLTTELADKNAKIRVLESRKPETKIVEKRVEVMPKDYEENLRLVKDLQAHNNSLFEENRKAKEQVSEANRRVRELEERSGKNTVEKDAIDDMKYFSTAVYNFISTYGGKVWALDQWGDIPQQVKTNFIKAVDILDAFSQQMKTNIGEFR